MVSNNLNSSLRNSMHRHPQILNKTAYFVGDGDSSNTFLRWMGTTWENVHRQYAENGYADLLEEHKPWNREYIPVCLANGAAGRFSLWDWYPVEAPTIVIPGSQQGNVRRHIGGVLGVANDVGYSSWGDTAGKLKPDYYDFEPSTPASITGSNVSRNDQAAGIGNKYYWPDGEYKSTIPADYLDPTVEGLENLAGGTIWPIGLMTGITVDMTWQQSGSVVYEGATAEYIEQVWNYENYQNGTYPFWFDGHDILDGTTNTYGRPNSVRLEHYPSSFGTDDRTVIINTLGYDVDNLQDTDTVTMVVQGSFIGSPKTYTAKISDCLEHSDDFGWNYDDFEPPLPSTRDDWTTGPMSIPIWGISPQITFKFNHSMPHDGVTWDNYTPQMEKTLRTPTRTVLLYDLNSIIPVGSPIKKAELHLTSRGRWNWPTAVAETPNYGTDEYNIYSNVHNDVWDSHEGGFANGSSAGATISRNHKIRRDEDYQLTMLHPATTKHATWKTYDGINPWSNLVATSGATTAYLPHVMSYGGGNDWNRAWPKNGGQFGLGWAEGDAHGGNSSDWDARGDYVNCEIHDSRKKWFCFHGDDDEHWPGEGPYEHPNHLDAILSPSPEEIKGISGGGVLVRLSTDQNDSSRLTNLVNLTSSIWTQGQIFDLTKRRYADTIDFKFNHEYENQEPGLSAGANESTTTIDITKFVEHAMQNEGGKLRMSLTGKFFNGAPPKGSRTTYENQDSFKTEASWSHNAYYGGESAGNHDPGGANDWTLPRYLAGITHPYYGEHTIKTEFYSMNDDELKLPVNKIKFSDTTEELSETIFDLDELIESIKDLKDLTDAEGLPWGIQTNINDGVYMTLAQDNLFTINCFIVKNPDWNQTILDAYDNMTNAWTNIYAKAQENNLTNNTPIQIKAGQALGGDVSPYDVTMGSTDINGGVGQRHGFVLNELVVEAPIIMDHLMLGILTLSVYSPNDNDQSDWLLRKTSDGEPWLTNDDATTPVFNNYFLGDYATSDSTFPDNTALIDEHSFKIVDLSNTPPSGSRQYFIGFPGQTTVISYLKEVGDIGSLVGITHSIPDGITHDNRGVYRIVDFTNDDTIEVNQIITNQGTIDSTQEPDYGNPAITVLDRRPYLEVTYGEQEDAGV